MVYAQARSPRLGQPTSVESAYVRMFSGDELPEAAWEGQLIYRNETQGLQIFNGNAWEDVVGGAAGVLTFVGSTPPLAQHEGDIWFDSSDDNRIYVAAAAGADSIGPGEWEDVSGAPPPLTATTWIYRQDTAPGAGDTPPPKDNDFWFETPDNKQYYYKTSAPGTHWIGVRDAGIEEAIVSSVIEYSLHTSETIAPTTGWSTTAPTRTPGTFIWVRTVTTRGDGSTSTSAAALMTGNTGAPGSTGSQGIPGPAGADGTPLYTWLKYADTPTTGMSDLPAGKAYLGLAYNKTTATESSTYGDYTWSLILGPEGDPGVPGVPGADGTPRYTWIKYGTSITGAGINDSSVGMTHIGIAYNKLTAVESTTPGDYEWSLIQGPQGTPGTPGTPGVSVTAITPYYAKITAGTGPPTQPTNQVTPPAPWVSTEPTYTVGFELWRTEKITYSSGSPTYTTVALVSSYTAAGAALTAANGKNTIYYSTAVPTGGTYIEGDTWFDVDNNYAMSVYTGGAWVLSLFGEGAIADASITNAKITDATIESAKIVGLDAGKITAGSMNVNLIVGGMITTSETPVGQRVEITTEGIVNYGEDGLAKVKLPTAGGGSAEFQGNLTADSLTLKEGGVANLQGRTNIGTGQDLVLTTGVSAPSTSPTLSAVYTTETTTDPTLTTPDHGTGAKWGLVWDGTHWNRLITTVGDKFMMQRMTTTGTVVSTTWTGISDIGGPKITMCRTPSRWYFMFRVANAPFAAWQISERDHSFNSIATWNYTSNQDTNNLPAIFVRTDATAGTQLTIAQVKTDGSMGLRHYSTSGTLQSTGTYNPSSPFNPVTDLGTAYVGEADFTGGVGRVLIPIRKGDYAFCEVFSEATMTPDVNRHFPLVTFSGGIGYNGTTTTNGQLWSADRDTLQICQYSTLQYETSGDYFSAGAATTYFDYHISTPRETLPGPIRTVSNIPKRCSIRLSVGALSPGANSVRFHYTPSTTLTPFATQPAVGALTALYTSLATAGTTPTSSGFTSGTASRLLSGTSVMLEGTKYGTFTTGDLKMTARTCASATPIDAGGIWLLCDGAAIPAEFTALIALVGATTPDLRSRFPVGVGTYSALLGHEGTAEADRTSRHTHGITAAAVHSHGAGSLVTADRSLNQVGTTATGGANANRLTQPDLHNHGISGSVADDGNHAHGGDTGLSPKTGTNHTVPFLGVNYLIKV